MKIGCVRADTRFNHSRTRTFEQLPSIEICRLRSDLGGDLPVAEMFSFAQASVGKRQTHPIVRDPKISGCFSHAIWREVFRPAGLEPIAAQHEGRAHDCAAAPVKPFLLLAR